MTFYNKGHLFVDNGEWCQDMKVVLLNYVLVDLPLVEYWLYSIKEKAELPRVHVWFHLST